MMVLPDKKETWRTRYLISVGLLVFFAIEYDRIIGTCLSAAGCREGVTTESLISGTQQGMFWSFVVIILGRAAQPLINQFALRKLGGTGDPSPPREGGDNAKP